MLTKVAVMVAATLGASLLGIASAEARPDVVGYRGRIAYDRSKPDGTPRKLLDVGRLHALGWRHRVDLAEGIDRTYRWFVEHHDAARLGASAAT